jgi:cation transport protein ChaC
MDRPAGDIWIFGYGSLMWRPNFEYLEMQPALLRGYHRSLCIYSTRYRGTWERPGLVLGLDRGGSCRGRAMRVADALADEVIAYLHERELVNYVYLPKWLPVEIPAGPVTAYAFIADRSNEKYIPQLSDEDAVKLILQGCGTGGQCLEYLQTTIRHLDELGIAEGRLHRITQLAERALERKRTG